MDEDGQTRAVLRMEGAHRSSGSRTPREPLRLRLTVRGTEGSIEYVDRGEVLNLMKPAPRVNPLTTR